MISRKDFLIAGLGSLGGVLGLKNIRTTNLSNPIGNPDIHLWDIFTEDFCKNCLSWYHNPHNPVIPASGKSWKMFWTANPSYLEFKGKLLLYYRGNGITKNSDGKRHDRIAVAEILTIGPGIFRFRDLNNGEFIIDHGEKGTFDDNYVLDPAAIIFRNQVYLYYSALGNGPNSIGLAISDDGVHFKKYGKVMIGRAPSVIENEGLLYMIYQIKIPDVGYVGFYLASSQDGKQFNKVTDGPVFITQKKGGWDNQIATGRLFKQGEMFYMMYGGNTTLVDQPDYFGLARSLDLIHWDRHPGNPIFGCGPKGSEDGGAMWFPALIEKDDYYHILYEGSRGTYGWQLSSQICMASIKKAKL